MKIIAFFVSLLALVGISAIIIVNSNYAISSETAGCLFVAFMLWFGGFSSAFFYSRFNESMAEEPKTLKTPNSD